MIDKMADWITIVALVLAILAIAAAVGTLIWTLVANTAQKPSYRIQTIEGNADTATSGGGDLMCISKSNAAKLTLTINKDSSATQGRFFIIINTGVGTIDVKAGTDVNIPATTLAKDATARYAITANNTYVRL